MKKFDKRVVAGTKVLIEGYGWHIVKSVHDSRKWLQVESFNGSFQRGHVLKFSNQDGPKWVKLEGATTRFDSQFQEVFRAVFAAGDDRWGVAIVAEAGASFPAKGKLALLGTFEGVKTFKFTADDSGQWFYVGGDLVPIADAVAVIPAVRGPHDNVSL